MSSAPRSLHRRRGLGVAERNETHLGQERAEALPVLGLAGDRERAHGAAVETALEGDEFDAIWFATHHGLIAPRELERRLVGLGARVTEEDLAGEGALGQGLGQKNLRLDVVEVRGVV